LQITSITRQKKRGRYNLSVDGEFWCGISDRVIAKFNLYKSKEITREELGDLFRDEIVYRLYDRSIRKIANRPNSRQEMERYLKNTLWKKQKSWFKGTPYEKDHKKMAAGLVDTVIGKLESESMIDDHAFAKWWVDQRIRSGRKGWYLIQSELRAKGISDELIKGVEVGSGPEREAAVKAYEKYCVRSKLPREKCIQRLLSRGFSWDIVKEVMEEGSADVEESSP
jgi:regulatory protein